MIYDIFYVSKEKISDIEWQQFRNRFPSAQKIENVTSIDDVKKKTFTKFFWLVWDDVVITDDFTFDYRVEKWDEDYVHVFKNSCNGVESYISGVALIPKKVTILKKEFDFKFYVNKKETNIVASKFRYPIRYIKSYEEYLKATNEETKPMFWCVWDNIEVDDWSDLDVYFDPLNGTYDYDRSTNHVFLNGCGDKTSYLNGIILCTRSNIFTKKEFDRKYIVDKKEHNKLISRFRYPRYYINSYNEYLEICKTETSSLFWCVWPDINIIDEHIFNIFFDPLDGKYDYDRGENHLFKNGEFRDGVILASKHKLLIEKEFKYRFPIEKKEWDIVASVPKPYDVVFISYNELNANENYEKLKLKRPDAKRVNGIKGIKNAHIAAAKLVTTEMFWVVDADAILESTFEFKIDYIPYYDSIGRTNLNKTVHVWSSQNPVNDLVYGYGGVKLLPRQLTLTMDTQNPDMTTSISDSFKIISEISNTTGFNVDPLSTWRSAFRECAKLSSQIIDRNYDSENDERLYTWCNVGQDRPFGEYAINGAKAGKKYGEENIKNYEALEKINDYHWLEEQFKEYCNE
jgi:hypothetical protein